MITTLANRYKLPAVYPFRYFVDVGGLMSYGPDLMSQFRPAAGYVDRILKGKKPAVNRGRQVFSRSGKPGCSVPITARPS